MNRKLLIIGAQTAGQLFGYAVGKWVRDMLPFLCIFLIVLTAASCVIGFSYYEENVKLAKENAHLIHNCMVLGEQGDILVPIEALEGDDNWKLR